MIILITGSTSSGTDSGLWRYITGYTSASTDGTVGGTVEVDNAFPSVIDSTSTYIIYSCGALPSISQQESCNYLSTTLQPLNWWPTTSSTIILDQASSIIDEAYQGWEIKIVNGSCKGQIRLITGYVGGLRKATVFFPWTTVDGYITDAYGAQSPIRLCCFISICLFGFSLNLDASECSGCFSPDNTTQYILYNQNYAPGSMESSNGYALRMLRKF